MSKRGRHTVYHRESEAVFKECRRNIAEAVRVYQQEMELALKDLRASLVGEKLPAN